ncbi:pentatricopeptide repeat-containing protein At2g20710, mitochondrial-like [Humulus lupulus]|uniref:pentatricopeptide repeat-containing protein At2g20710, mitochondrial-like n=1 Tax=Humulus lupulus TaxID=3486 RepID=UPI002B40BBF6|nr:pentatricopeptide repeat-containing protein At2g20710, mitochondrial-like [Humulus lupulus]
MKHFAAKPWSAVAISRVVRAFFYSNEAISSSSPRTDTLYHRMSRLGDPKISMTPVLEQWAQEGRDVKQSELQKIIKQFRKYRRFTQALQISEWLSEANFGPSSRDIAIHLDLISKVYGLERAEENFNSIPESFRIDKVHGTLLNCYTDKKSLEKAEDLFQKMKKMGFIQTALTYNAMLSLYSRMGKHEKLKILTQEMEQNGIKFDRFTLNIQLNAYAVTSNIEEMEKLLLKIEADHQIALDFHSYFIAANGYLKAGFPEKALIKLNRSEQVIPNKERKIAYERLLTLYAATGKKDEVYRIWNLFKNVGRVYNTGYLSMFSSLVKLDDIDGMEKIFEEWESVNTLFDNRIANLMLSAYCKKGLLEKAFVCVDRLFSNSGYEPDANLWLCLSTQCCIDGEMGKAVECMKKAILAGGPRWKVNRTTFVAFLEYLKKEGNMEPAHEILRLLHERGFCSDDFHRKFVEYLNSDKDLGALVAMEADNNKEENDDAVDGKMSE